MAAVTRVSYASGTGPTLVSAETGVIFNKEETLAGSSTSVAKPTSAGTAYSWVKPLCLQVITADTTSISNRRVRIGSVPITGLQLFYRSDGETYQRGTSGPANNLTTDGATPAGFAMAPTSDAVYDAATQPASLGRNGGYTSWVMGVSNSYGGGPSSAAPLPNIIFVYDEE